MASANFRLGYSAVSVAGPWTWGAYGAPIDAGASNWIKVELESTAGIATINVTIPRADEVVMAAGVPTVTIDQVTKTATFQIGADAATYCVEVTGNPSSTSPVTAKWAVHVLTTAGFRLMAYDETTESDAAYKWLGKINALLRAGAVAVETGVVAGSWNAPRLTVDAYGRVTAMAAPTGIELAAGADRTIAIAASATPDDLIVSAAASTGGEPGGVARLIGAESAEGDDGSIVIETSAASVMLELVDDKIGAFGATPVVQPSFSRTTVDWTEIADGLADLGWIELTDAWVA